MISTNTHSNLKGFSRYLVQSGLLEEEHILEAEEQAQKNHIFPIKESAGVMGMEGLLFVVKHPW